MIPLVATQDTDSDRDPNRDARTQRRSSWLGFLLLVLVAAGLRLSSIDHGLPARHVPDTSIVRQALGMARDKNPVPQVGQYSTYPNLLPYMLLPAYAGHFVIGKLDGSWSGAQEYGEALSADPSPAHLLARILIALFGVATVGVAFRAARAAGLQHGAFVAAWLVATGLLHLHFSVQERPWVPMVFFFALASWAAICHEKNGSRRSLMMAGIAAGLAFATHQAGLIALGIPGLAWLLAPRGFSGEDLRRRLADGVLCVALFTVVGVLIGHPYLLVHGATPETAIVPGEAAGPAGISVGGQSFDYHFSLASLKRLSGTFFSYDPVLTVLGLLGLVPLLLRRGARAVFVFAALWSALFLTHHNDHVRYLLPLSFWLALPAGALFDVMYRRRVRAWRALLGATLLALPLIQSMRLVQVLGRTDLRVDAAEELAALPPGSRVVIDRYGPRVARDAASLTLVEELRALRGEALYIREARRLAALRSGELTGGTAAVYAEDFLSFDDRDGADRGSAVRVRAGLEGRLGATVRESLATLIATHVLIVNRRYADLSEHPLSKLVGGQEPIAVINPAGDGPFVSAWLPLEMTNPLVELWRVERPGPWMGLYRLGY